MPIGEETEHLLAHTRLGGIQDAGVVVLHRRQRILLNPKTETRRKLDGPHHAHRVFLEADGRVANRADNLAPKVLHPTNPVNDTEVADVVEEPVNRKVAPVGIGLGCSEGIVLKRPFRCVLNDFPNRLRILAEGRRLNHLLAEADMGKPKAPPDEEAVAERTAHFVRFRACADVEVLRRAPHQQITDTTAHEVGGVAKAGEAVKDLQGIRVDVLARNAVLRSCVHDRLPRLLLPFFEKSEH